MDLVDQIRRSALDDLLSKCSNEWKWPESGIVSNRTLELAAALKCWLKDSPKSKYVQEFLFDAGWTGSQFSSEEQWNGLPGKIRAELQMVQVRKERMRK